jgi:hypothetical protein
MSNGIIEAYIEEDTKLKLQDYNEFSKSTEYIKDIEEEHEKLLSGEKRIPDKHLADKVSTTILEIDLSLVALMKSTSHKLIKLEKFLSKIEDIIFNDKTLADLDKGKLLQLYGQTRIMRGELLKSLNELKEKVDVDRLEGQIQALNIQNNKNEITTLDEIVEKILENDGFLDESIKVQLSEIDKIKEE